MKFSKSNLYKRLFITYTIVILSVVSILCIYFLSKTSEEIKRNNLYLNDKILQDVNETLEYNSSTSRRIMNMLYEDDFRLNDVIKYLNSDLVDYIKGKLDYYSASDKLYYNGIESFVKDIEYAIYNKNEISIINEIRDAASLKPEGMLMTTYDVGVISDVIKKYKDTNSEVLILNKEGMVLYDSENKYDYEYYPYFDKLKVGRHEILLEDSYYVDILPDNNGLMSVVRIKVSNATKVPLLFKVCSLYKI